MPTITVQFEKPPGTPVATRQFDPGDRIRVAGWVSGPLGLGEPGLKVRLEIADTFPPLYQETATSWAPWEMGRFSFDVTLPQVVSQATVAVTAWFTVGGAERVVVPIGIGAAPAPIPAPAPGLLDTLLPLLVMVVALGLVTQLPPLLKEMAPPLVERARKRIPGG